MHTYRGFHVDRQLVVIPFVRERQNNNIGSSTSRSKRLFLDSSYRKYLERVMGEKKSRKSEKRKRPHLKKLEQ
jgi:hypothetical protein